MKPLLIGQAPGPNTDPSMPLYPLPKTSAGGRLQALMGMSRGQYLRTFDRVNLLQFFPGKHKRDDKFPLREAKIAAAAIRPLLVGREIVLIGRNVANAFGMSLLPFHTWCEESDCTMSVVPHTSGRNHWYNSEENREAARLFWAEYLSTRGLPVPPEEGNLGAVGLEMAS